MSIKVAITKKGYDILRIVPGKSDGDTCEFKIIPMVKSEDIRIFTMQLFSNSELISFDTNCELEITYHKATLSKPTKIHLKLKDSNNEITYIKLPLNRLLDPNVNTEIPIPLLKLTIPDEILTTKYITKKDHKNFDIEDSNIVEIYMEKAGNIDYFEKWRNINILSITTPIQYFVTGKIGFIGNNLGAHLYNSKVKKHHALSSADVTNEIRITINTIESLTMETDKLDFLFIENECYLAFAGGTMIYNEEYPKGIMNYKLDLKNEKFFTDKEREKWEYRFKKEFEKLNKLIIRSNGKYQQQFVKKDREDKEVQAVRRKVVDFKNRLKKARYEFWKNNKLIYEDSNVDDYKQKINEAKLLEYIKEKHENSELFWINNLCAVSQDINILLAKYLEMNKMFTFVTTFKIPENIFDESDLEFNEVLLFYKKYVIEVLRGEINEFLEENSEFDLLIYEKLSTVNEYFKSGFCKKLVINKNFKIVDQDFFGISKENFESLFEDKDGFYSQIYEKIIEQ